MKKFLISLFLLFFTVIINAQITYYVSSSLGRDDYPGTLEKPFKTLSKVNSLNLNAGDKILFRSGDKWKGEYLIINSSGSNDKNRIILSSYGDGAKPIIDLRDNLPGWSNSSNWTKYSGDTVWVINYSASYRALLRLWLNGIEYVRAISLTGDNADGTFGLNRVHRFYKDNNENKLYVYSPSGNNNPASYYTSIDYPGVPDNTIYLKDADYITIDGLDVRGGMYSAIGLGGSDYVIIKNCDIGENSNWAGIAGQFGNSNDKICNNDEIENNIIDSHRRITQNLYDGVAGVEYGISVSNGADSWLIHNNKIIDWSFGTVTIATSTGYSKNHSFYNNEVYHTSYNLGWGKGIQINGNLNFDKGYTWVKVYNNYFHDLSSTGVSVCGNGNYIFYNIISKITVSVSTHATQSNSGIGIQLVDGLTGVGVIKNCYIFNNTFYQNNNRGVQDNGNLNSYFNNIFANCNMVSGSPTSIQLTSWGTYTIENNLFFRKDMLQNNYFAQKGLDYYTVSQLNSFLSLSSDAINKQYTGNLDQLLDVSNFMLLDTKAVKNSFNISNLVPEGFKDRNGIAINREDPNMGAIANIKQESTGFKVYLQGPYYNSSMKTELGIEKLIPLSQPYNVSPWKYPGNESVSAIPSNIVDWILVELRSSTSPSSIVDRKAAFLRNDGNITGLDGVSPLTFNSTLTGNYYIVIKHRNHLAVMSSQPVKLINSTIQYDFTTSEDKAYGQNSLIDLGSGVYGMIGGDVDANGTINDTDVIDVSQNLFNNGYSQEDSDLNSPVNVLDYKLPKINQSRSTNVQ